MAEPGVQFFELRQICTSTSRFSAVFPTDSILEVQFRFGSTLLKFSDLAGSGSIRTKL